MKKLAAKLLVFMALTIVIGASAPISKTSAESTKDNQDLGNHQATTNRTGGSGSGSW